MSWVRSNDVSPVDGQRDVGEHLRAAAAHAHLRHVITPGTLHRRGSTSSRTEAGTPSSSAITVRLPSWKLTQITITATPRAATASAFTSQAPAASSARQHAGQPDDHHRGRPDVGGEVQGVGLQGLAVVLFGGAVQDAGPRVVDHDRR